MFKKQLMKIKVFKNLARYYSFVRRNGYFPNISNPKTFNEKIQYRKRQKPKNIFSLCSDKILVKEYVENILKENITVENYYVGDNISRDVIKSKLNLHGDVLVKANHNSGPVHLVTSNASDEKIDKVCQSINNQLKIDYGKLKQESWYSEIKPRVLIEKRLLPEEGEENIRDYKFHVFKQVDGTMKIVLHVDFDRDINHTRSFFDEDLNWLPFAAGHAAINTKIVRPDNYDNMLDIVKKLATPFSYVRIDLYNIAGAIYFGEMTFAHAGGSEPFSFKEYDIWMGNLWAFNDENQLFLS